MPLAFAVVAAPQNNFNAAQRRSIAFGAAKK